MQYLAPPSAIRSSQGIVMRNRFNRRRHRRSTATINPAPPRHAQQPKSKTHPSTKGVNSASVDEYRDRLHPRIASRYRLLKIRSNVLKESVENLIETIDEIAPTDEHMDWQLPEGTVAYRCDHPPSTNPIRSQVGEVPVRRAPGSSMISLGNPGFQSLKGTWPIHITDVGAAGTQHLISSTGPGPSQSYQQSINPSAPAAAYMREGRLGFNHGPLSTHQQVRQVASVQSTSNVQQTQPHSSDPRSQPQPMASVHNTMSLPPVAGAANSQAPPQSLRNMPLWCYQPQLCKPGHKGSVRLSSIDNMTSSTSVPDGMKLIAPTGQSRTQYRERNRSSSLGSDELM